MTCLSPGNCFINVNNQFFDPNTVLRATLSNDLGGELVARYKLDPVPVTLYGGWIYARQMNPSDDFLGGFPTIAQGIFVPPGAFNKSGVYTNSAITANNFDIQRVLNTFWFGARWKIRFSDLEAMGGFYYQNQNNFNPAACTGSGAFISSSQMRRKPGWVLVPARLEAGQACRHLRRRPGQQCLRRPCERLLLDLDRLDPRNAHGPERQHGPDAELRPDCRHPYSLLAAQEARAPRGRARRPSIRRVAVDATLVAIVLIFAQSVLVALVIRIGRDMRQGQAKRRRLRRWRRATTPAGAMAGPCAT